MRKGTVSLVAAGVAVIALVTAVQAQDYPIDDVKAKFGGLSQSEIEAMGYAQQGPCVDASELPPPVLSQLGIPATAAMRIHFINVALIDTTLDPLEPESIQLGPDGTVWNVEYITPPQADPLEILGQKLSYVEATDSDALHLWLVDSPAGQFVDFNAAVTCAVQPPSTGSAGLRPLVRELAPRSGWSRSGRWSPSSAARGCSSGGARARRLATVRVTGGGAEQALSAFEPGDRAYAYTRFESSRARAITTR